ncbi:MAG: DUF4412 domain-containing protein [Pseudomonadota bacterium]|nr:DUF4412 domain-containing protein [Pseudomonadota bacterium]
MKPILSLSICILACAAATRGHAADDLTVVSTVATNGKPAGSETSYISSDHIRTSQTGGTDMIINLKTGVMTTIDEKKKTYYEVTKQDMQAMQAKMAEKMNDPKMKQAMAMMQGMTNSMAGSTEVKKTGVSRKVAGFACEEWSITMGGMMTMTECVTNDIKYPVQSWAALKDFQDSMRKSMSGSGFGPSAKASADYAEKMKSIKGFPVASSSTVDAGVMKMTTSSEVTEVRHTAIPDSTWEVPAGFAKVDSPMMKAFQEHDR